MPWSEDFGFLDGVSQPAVTGFVSPNAGQAIVPAGVILVGEANDTGHPDWAKTVLSSPSASSSSEFRSSINSSRITRLGYHLSLSHKVQPLWAHVWSAGGRACVFLPRFSSQTTNISGLQGAPTELAPHLMTSLSVPIPPETTTSTLRLRATNRAVRFPRTSERPIRAPTSTMILRICISQPAFPLTISFVPVFRTVQKVILSFLRRWDAHELNKSNFSNLKRGNIKYYVY